MVKTLASGLTMLFASLVFAAPEEQEMGDVPTAEPSSQQPYIERLKKKLPKEKSSKETYIERMKKKLAREQPPGEQEESYIERIRSQLKEEDSRKEKASLSWSERERKKLLKSQSENTTEGAIARFKKGESDLELKRPGSIHHAAGFRLGAAINREIASAKAGTGFSELYGDGWIPDFTVFYEFQPFHSEWFGNIGLAFSAGLSHHNGMGTFKNQNLLKAWDLTPFGEESRTVFRFFTVPATAGVNYRFNLLRILRPYVQVGGAAIGFIEARSDNVDGHRGYSTGILMSGGVNLLLDWFSRGSAWALYEAGGIKRSYLTIDYSRLSTLSGDVDFTVSGLSAGFTFEF